MHRALRLDSPLRGEGESSLACVAVCWVLLARLRWGRHLYAVGGNEEAARLSGVPVLGTKLLAYGLCGFFAAVAGICQAAEELQGDPEAGQTYELTAIAVGEASRLMLTGAIIVAAVLFQGRRR